MSNERKMVVLSLGGVTKGTLKLERNDDSVTASLVVFGLEKSRYALLTLCFGKMEHYPFPPEPPYKFTLSPTLDFDKTHFSVCKSDGEVVMYGTLNRERLKAGSFPRWVDDAKSEEENNISREEEKSEVRPVVTDIFPTGEGYEDNQVATENYFAENVDKEEITAVFVGESETAKEEITAEIKEVEGRKMTFYEKNKESIDRLFSEGEREEMLQALLPQTKWVKVSYDESRHYIVGLVGETPDYICYGLPGVYSSHPPIAESGYTQWLPISVREPHGKGYWVLYQCAKTGETIKRE